MRKWRLSGAAWSPPARTLRESTEIYRALGIHAIDLLALPGFLVDFEQIIESPTATARPIKDISNPPRHLAFFLAGNFSDRALNHKDDTVRRRKVAEFHGLLNFAATPKSPRSPFFPELRRKAGPGRNHGYRGGDPESSWPPSPAQAAWLSFSEPHVGSILDSTSGHSCLRPGKSAVKPRSTIRNFVWNGHSQSEIDALAPYAGHVHLRQAAPRVMQARWTTGTIDFPAVVSVLKQSAYNGYLALEYSTLTRGWTTTVSDELCETIQMRDAVLFAVKLGSLVSKRWNPNWGGDRTRFVEQQ